MTTATATAAPPRPPRQTVHLWEPGDVIAALPPLIGFHPTDSLVILYLVDRARLEIQRVLRADLPSPAGEEEFIAFACDNILESGATSVQLCVIGGDTRTAAQPEESGTVVALPTRPPRRALVLALTQVLRKQGIEVMESLWAESTRHNASWQDYEHPENTGAVPDPDASLLTVATVAAGGITYNSREELAKNLEGEEQALNRRSCRLDWHTDHTIPGGGPTPAAGIRAIQAELKNIADGSFTVTDNLIVRLALALNDHRVRDVALTMTLREEAGDAAERLWLELTRETPAPECAEPATLLAFAAYRRGDGVLANIALEHATKAQPSHMLASLLGRAIDAGLPPKDVLTAVNNTHRLGMDIVIPQQSTPVD
ncbi:MULTISPECIES: DUF4192 domain-containing protein [unclassified Crossiella]|uniref:DUF4192 domain-containing protein n=1 Tax=unclassified Crossiella TaxID=2620835 RepID=UPI00200024B9|nr:MULTISPECIES: DUF4192 domain-containing protein [unclassified Crossiella]MCK2240334.1 DUF4192 domain-containing protein [Crossiella sp. S99.2]MCK2253214.1 DUF4192 domain-containing protein [Crossiella sp. S99.1]